MSNSRQGIYGKYIGSYYDGSKSLTKAQQQINAKYIWSFLKDHGWSMNAVAGMLGNMQEESSINPGRWQSDDVGDTYSGYGLVQWTPASKYINWCKNNGYSDPSEMDNNLRRILYELENNIQYAATSSYNLSFKEFSVSTKSASYLGKAFLLNYERPKDQSVSNQNARGAKAETWFEYLQSVDPSTPVNPSSGTRFKRKKFNFILFNYRRRMRT